MILLPFHNTQCQLPELTVSHCLKAVLSINKNFSNISYAVTVIASITQLRKSCPHSALSVCCFGTGGSGEGKAMMPRRGDLPVINILCGWLSLVDISLRCMGSPQTVSSDRVAPGKQWRSVQVPRISATTESAGATCVYSLLHVNMQFHFQKTGEIVQLGILCG